MVFFNKIVHILTIHFRRFLSLFSKYFCLYSEFIYHKKPSGEPAVFLVYFLFLIELVSGVTIQNYLKIFTIFEHFFPMVLLFCN